MRLRLYLIAGVCFLIAQESAWGQLAPPPVAPVPLQPPVAAAADEKPSETKSADEDATDEEESEAAPEAKKAPDDTVQVQLRDGMVVAGKLKVDRVTVETEFGELEVPILKLHGIRPGLESQPQRLKMVEDLITALDDNDFKTREAAQKKLVSLGPPVRGLVAPYVEDSSTERARRAKLVIEQLDEAAADASAEGDGEGGAAEWIAEDEIVTDEFTVLGRIAHDSFTIESKYGELKVALSDIVRMHRDVPKEEDPTVRKSMPVEGKYLVGRELKNSKIRLRKGDRVVIAATGRIAITPYGSDEFTSPDGWDRYGSQNIGGVQFPTGTLAGRIGSNGKLFRIGSNSTFKAEENGVLELGIVVPNHFMRNSMQFPGQYDLKIKVNRAPEGD